MADDYGGITLTIKGNQVAVNVKDSRPTNKNLKFEDLPLTSDALDTKLLDLAETD